MITQTAEYALRATVCLAANVHRSISCQELAEQVQVPADYLTKVLQDLSRNGLVKAQRGRGGGYRLEKSPLEITIRDVVVAVSPLPRIDTCPLGIEDHVELCPLHSKLQGANRIVEEIYCATSIKDLVPISRQQSECQFPHR